MWEKNTTYAPSELPKFYESIKKWENSYFLGIFIPVIKHYSKRLTIDVISTLPGE